MEESELFSLIKEAHETKLLKNFLAAKLTSYGGIKHEELENICIIFDITKEGESG